MRHDPIRDKYFKPIEDANKWFDLLFYLATLLSFLVLYVDKTAHPTLYNFIQIFFVISVIVVFSISHIIRLYLIPRGEDRRRQDFLSQAYGVSLNHERTSDYYNNDLSEPLERLAAQLLENAFFSKSIILKMCKNIRIYLACYMIFWLCIVFFRNTDLATVAIIAQTVFSEQLLSRWLRFEWLRTKVEKTYDDLYRLFQSNSNIEIYSANALEAFANYEAAKSNAGITLSSKTFFQLNYSLSKEWEEIKKTLNIK